jgi:hypothetical protein
LAALVGYSDGQNSDLGSTSLDHFRYPLHFSLLACFSLLLIAMTQLRLATDLSLSFALYGALHAAALIIALRAHHPIWRKCLFIAAAAVLSAMTLHFGIIAGQLLGTSRGNAALYAVLGLSGALGAAAYGVLIHLSGIYQLTSRPLAVICVNCLLATCAAIFTLTRFHSPGRWWLAVMWWCAFSGGLWYFDKRNQRAVPGRRGDGAL